MEIKRDIYLQKLIERKHNGMIKVITGLRRSGKSYLLFNLFYHHLISTGVTENHILRIDLENRRNRALRDPDALLQKIDSLMIDDKMYYILLDEVQLVPEFEDVLNSYLKIENADVYVTGSNSRFLSKDVITEFRGRGDEIHIMPLCFAEFFSVYDGSRDDALAEYLTYGGMPKTVGMTHSQKSEYLKSLFRKTYLTDIQERYNIRNAPELEEIIDVLSSSIGGLVNPQKIIDTFLSKEKLTISKPTIKNYLEIIQDVFLVEKSLRYDIKGRKYIDTPAKYYYQDLGLRNARLNFRQIEESHLIENLIYNELRIRGFSVDVGIVEINSKDEQGKSYRKQLEVDFVCNQGNARYYIQSALHLPNANKREQEVRSLNYIKDNFLKFIITEDHIIRHQDENGVVWMNIFDFLLNPNSLEIT